MGSRTNWTIVTTDNPDQNIHVYSHWDGEDGENLLVNAVTVAMPRLNTGDISYATRIIIDQLTKDGRDEEVGYGINVGRYPQNEEEYQYKEVNLINKTITIGRQKFDLESYLGATI